MKHLFSTFILLTFIVACSSNEKKVDKMAQSYDPILEKNAQVERVITMIKNDEGLNDQKKEELVALVKETSVKADEIKKEQSQLRALLINQLLESSDGSSSQVLATSKELEKLTKKNIKGLNDFIIKFKAISGERDIQQNQFMHEVGNIHML